MFQVWWSYYQCEPFGSHWEQTANLAAMMHAQTSMMAASHGVKAESFGVIDFMPRDSMKWMRRKKKRSSGITSPKAHAMILPKMFGFTT